MEKWPGSLMGLSPKLIFVRMLRRIGSFKENTKMHQICELHAKFNDALNDEVSKIDQYILTINSCNTFEHFDRMGLLSPKGKVTFWREMDDLL